MNLKLLVAACCLLAAVQARPPKPSSDSPCSLSCVSRTFWTGYQVGSAYTYQFEQKVQLSTDLSSSQASRLRVSGEATVEVHSDCEMALTVDVKSARVGDIDSAAEAAYGAREPPAKVLQALRLPLRFSFEDGRVTQLCPSDRETRASLNFKRGLLSQLQVSTEQRGQSQQLEERDILGDCWTEYTPAGPNTLLKTKDLSRCKKLNYQAYPLTGVKYFDSESSRPVTKGSLKCRIEIDAERDIVKETSCAEEQTHSADHGPQDSAKETVRTNTKLVLKSEASGLASVLREVSKRSDLRHEHKTSRQCHSASAWLEEDLFHSANECVERQHGAKNSAEFKAQAKKILEELCRDTQEQGMTRDTPKKYADLIKFLRGITEQEDFDQLYQWVRDGYCQENPMLKTILRAAIPTVGTKQSVSLILQLLGKGEVEASSRSGWLVNGIALMQHPTPDILPELLNYVRKQRDEAMLGVSRDEPLALSAVVHKLCQELPNCEAQPQVKAVIDYFSDSLGPACDRLRTDADAAFAALLSVGNMGRIAGGAAALTRCAANPRLPTVHRAFALHSLRRFDNFSTEASSQLADLMLNSTLDAELRIAAYQTLSRHGFVEGAQLPRLVRQLLDSETDDRQVQLFVYTHLQSLRGQQAARLAASILRAAKTAGQLKKLSKRQHSSSQRFEYFSKSLGAGAQAEVPIVFTAQSAIPRYVGLNLTVNSPSQGQSINLMEIGLRMQGLESLVEEIYSRIAKKFGPEPAASDRSPRRAADEQPALTPEQRQLKQTPEQPRIDLLLRRYGAELSHTDLSGGMLSTIPEIAAKADYATLANLLAPSASDADQLGASAGTLAENTLSIPTVTGLPILVKKELHYLTNLRVSKNFRIGSASSADATLELRPAAAVLMSRTLAVDAIFERAGIRSSTSFLTSTGLRLSLKSNFLDRSDRQFSFKVEPLVKKQNVADAKTEVNFFQHTAGQAHIEKPLKPHQSSIKSESCTGRFVKKYAGHKLCYKMEHLPSCNKALTSFCQCPGSYQLYLEKSDEFGAYEVSFSLKNQPKHKQLQVLIGDRKSKDRLLKFNVQSISRSDRTNYKLELQNPIFPVVMDSNVTKASQGYQVYSEMQAGSVDYIASGSVKSHPTKGLNISGEFYPRDKEAQKVQVSLEHKFRGFSSLLLLPKATTKLNLKMHTGNKLSAAYKLEHDASKFIWRMSSEYETSKGDATSMRYRLEGGNKVEDNQDTVKTFLYDFELKNPSGKNLIHSLHAKVSRLSRADGKQITAGLSHKLQHGAAGKPSPVDFEARLALKEASSGVDEQLFRATGSGEFTYYKGGKLVTAQLENLDAQVGEAADETDGFGKQYTYAVKYGVKFDDTSANYHVELRHLNWKRWSLSQQAIELKAKAQLGSKSYAAHLKHSLNGEKIQGRQIAKLEKNEYVYFHLDHKLQKPESKDGIKHELYLQDASGNKVQAKCGIAWPEAGTLTSDTVVEVNGKKTFRIKQTMSNTVASGDHQLKHELTLELEEDTYTKETTIKISPQSVADLASFLSYQVRLLNGRYSVRKSLYFFGNFLRELRLKQSTKLVGPTKSAILGNDIDMSKSEGICWKNLLQVTSNSKNILNYDLTVTKSSSGALMEVSVKDQWLNTDMKARLEGGGWADLFFDQYATSSAAGKRATAKVQLEGNVDGAPITSGIDITIGKDRLDSKKTRTFATISVTGPESKAKLNLNQTWALSPMELAAGMALNSNFGLLPFKELKTNAEFSLRQGLMAKMNAELDGTRIVSTKLRAGKNIFTADLKTAHPQLQEAGVKVALESDAPESIKCEAIAKFVGLNKVMQIKKTGTATLGFNSPVYSILAGLTGNMELQGFEHLIKYKKLEYELMLKKKPGMEFQFLASVTAPDQSSAKLPMIYLTSTLNYWPFKAELKFKANNYQGWEVKHGARAEFDYKSAFAGIEFNDNEAAATYEIQEQSGNTKRANFRVKCNFCVNNERDLLTGRANMTWPLSLSEMEIGMDTQINSPMLQRITFRLVHTPAKKQVMASFVWNGSKQKLLDCYYTQVSTEGGVRGDARLLADLRFFLGEVARVKVRADYKYGKDKELSCALTLADSDQVVMEGKVFWLSAPRNYDSIPVASVDCGFQIKGLGIDAYAVRCAKSGESRQWRVSVSQPARSSVITAKLELQDGVFKSGQISAFDRVIVLTSNPDGSIKATLSSGADKTYSMQWSGKYESLKNMRGKLEIEADGQDSTFEVTVQPKQLVIKYGKSDAPNTLKIDYEVTTGMWHSSADWTISHETDAENSELTLLPGYRIPVPTTRYPFKLVASSKAGARELTINFESAGLNVKSLYYKHDFSGFPQSFNVESSLIRSDDAEKSFEIKINMDRAASNAEFKCLVGKMLKLAFKESKLQIQLKRVIDLTVKLPKYDNSDSKEMAVRLTLPALNINEPINLKATLQKLPEGQKLELTYGRSDEEQAAWSLTARKFRMSPTFDIDLKAELTCKDCVIRSVDGRLKSSMERRSGGYIIEQKNSFGVNGEDWFTAELSLEGTRNSLPSKGEMTTTGSVECTLKFDLGDAEKPAKASFSMDKFGSSRDKYSLELSASPRKPGAWCPDFKVEIENPQRKFVLGKESKETDSESRVEMQFYLNKLQSQGITIDYKVESLASGVPKLTVEIGLPTRKIRTVCQPETADKKLGVMITFAWDADNSPEKMIGLDARVDYSSDVVAVLECKAPFLRNRMRLEGRINYREAGFTAELKHLSDESEVLKIGANYSYERQAQKNIVRLNLETSGAVQAKIGAKIRSGYDDDRSRGYWRPRIDGALKIELGDSVQKNIKFVYRPAREITVSCDQGASVSVKYVNKDRLLRQLIVFVSANDKSAARLKLECSKPAGKVTAKLDIGSGSFSHSSDLSVPVYRPETVLLRASIGAANKELHAVAFVGEATVGQKLSAWEADRLPSHLTFFAAGLRLKDKSGVKYSVNWRTPSEEKTESIIDSMKRAVQDWKSTWYGALSSAFDGLSTGQFNVASGIDSAWLTNEIGSIAANDMDQFARYVERAMAENEFYLRQIDRAVRSAKNVARRWLAALADAAASLKARLNELRIFENIAEAAQRVWNAAIDLAKRIPIGGVWQTIAEYFESAKSFADYWYAQVSEKLNDFINWFSEVASNPSMSSESLSELIQQAGDYLDQVLPISSAVKDTAAQLFGNARSVIRASLAGVKSLVVDDLLPLAVNHLEDAQNFKEIYDSVAFQLRLWYDTGATAVQRDALSQLLNYIWSDEALNSWRSAADAFNSILNGDISGGISQLLGEASSVAVWRPECDSECQRGGAPAAVEGSLALPVYALPSDAWRLLWRAPCVVLKRIGDKLSAGGAPEAASVLTAAALGWRWDPLLRLLAVRHRTAVLAGGSHLITFDGLALTHRRPCAYLVARDFQRGDFAVVQEYRRTGSGRRSDAVQQRGSLRVRFGDIRVAVTPQNVLRVDGRPVESLPLKKTSPGGKSLEASHSGRSNELLTVRFHGNGVRDALVLRCSFVADSCAVSVHPLYQNRVRGLAGSNDGRRDNDIRRADAPEHLKFWTAGECLADTDSDAAIVKTDAAVDGGNCRAWFGGSDSPMSSCYDAVDPKAFSAICMSRERAGGVNAACQTARQYVQRCRVEGVRVALPAKCAACQLSKAIEQAADGLVKDKAALRERLQVVFLVENSACARRAIGGEGANKIRRLARLIANLESSNRGLRSIQYGLARFSSDESEALTSLPVGDEASRFGSIEELNAALSRLRLSEDSDESDSAAVLRAIAQLPKRYQWSPLAQKHLIVVACKPCTAGAPGYAEEFARAQSSVKDQVFVHSISKAAIDVSGFSNPELLGFDATRLHDTDGASVPREGRDDTLSRRYRPECSAELATESDTTAKGSVWRLDQFANDSNSLVHQMLVAKEMQPTLRDPGCKRCSCKANSNYGQRQQQQQQQQQPECRIVSCGDN